ncbi:hypothetical protein [Anabaena sp. CA = ATCC 33047]|uniref:hypothetical protein n=1 Tax=Anabaena sp. (strain CA / ATCC 33047) TaxID=52271 RepID=UPI0012EE4E89|nr:hypothetical protein [Anabaena sp. CA = ATCC 33047]
MYDFSGEWGLVIGDEEDVACFSYETLPRSLRDATRTRSVSVGFTRRVGDEEAGEAAPWAGFPT